MLEQGSLPQKTVEAKTDQLNNFLLTQKTKTQNQTGVSYSPAAKFWFGGKVQMIISSC